MKNHCDQQLLAAKQAFREWQAKESFYDPSTKFGSDIVYHWYYKPAKWQPLIFSRLFVK